MPRHLLPHGFLARSVLLLTCALALSLGGCQVLYFLAGSGNRPALYTLPKKSRVLVMVDPRPASGTPVDVPALLGERLNDHLYRHKAADNFVAQARLTELQRDPDYQRMGIADIARRVEADVVVHVDLLQFSIQDVSEGQIMQGYAQALVKVVDRDGKRLWPQEVQTLGAPVQARVAPDLNDHLNASIVRNKLMDDLTVFVGRIFHEYDIQDKEINR